MKLLAAGAATEFVMMRILQVLRQESKKCLDGWVVRLGREIQLASTDTGMVDRQLEAFVNLIAHHRQSN